MYRKPDALREMFLVLMEAAPMREYSDDPDAYIRVGMLLARQAEDQSRQRSGWPPAPSRDLVQHPGIIERQAHRPR
jgi:hypothetical protein